MNAVMKPEGTYLGDGAQVEGLRHIRSICLPGLKAAAPTRSARQLPRSCRRSWRVPTAAQVGWIPTSSAHSPANLGVGGTLLHGLWVGLLLLQAGWVPTAHCRACSACRWECEHGWVSTPTPTECGPQGPWRTCPTSK